MRKVFLISAIALFFITACNSRTAQSPKPSADTSAPDTITHHKVTPVKDSVKLKDTTTKHKVISTPVQTSSPALRNFRQEGYTEATIKNMTGLDGCSFMLTLSNGKELEPNNLENAFKQEELKVWVKYTPVNFASICMAGQTIHIVAIEKR